MTDNYWIFKLRIPTLIKILKARNRGTIGTVTYIETTKPASVVLRWFIKHGVFTFPIHQIQQRTGPAGPMFHLSSVRDDKGRVITFDINHHVLELRQEILHHLMKRLKHFHFFTAYRSTGLLAAYLGIQIARDINGLVFMAHYARWKEYRPGSTVETENIYIIPKSEWSAVLKEHFQKMQLRVMVEKRFKHRTGLFIAMAKHLVRSLSGLIGSASHKTLPGSSSAADSKLMVSYAMGIAQDRRNDIGFFHAVKENNKNLDASRLLFYFRFKNLYPSDTELEWFKQNNVSCFTSPPVAGEISSLPLWKPSAGFKAHLKEFYRIFIKTAVPCLFTPRMPRVWVLNNLWEMGWNVSYWKDFFIANNVRVLVHSVPGVWNFIPNLALSETGGLAVNLERSILFDYCTYFHNSPNHVNFVTGSYSLTQIPEPSFSFHTIQAGGINVGNHPPIPWIDERRKENKIVISVFDELPNDWYFGESVRQFYESLIQLVESDGSDRFVLVIKTKKPEVLERLETVNRQVRELTASGKCLFPDWKVTPASAAAHSDLVVCVPSTAAFESVLTGTPTLVFSPMKSGSSIFYTENGLDRRVFEDGASMIDAIRRFAEGDSSVGNCTDLMTRIDPFGDGNGAQRVGEYLLECLRGFDSRLTRDQILEKANRRFRQQWGDDKLTHETAYESWD